MTDPLVEVIAQAIADIECGGHDYCLDPPYNGDHAHVDEHSRKVAEYVVYVLDQKGYDVWIAP